MWLTVLGGEAAKQKWSKVSFGIFPRKKKNEHNTETMMNKGLKERVDYLRNLDENGQMKTPAQTKTSPNL